MNKTELIANMVESVFAYLFGYSGTITGWILLNQLSDTINIRAMYPPSLYDHLFIHGWQGTGKLLQSSAKNSPIGK